MESNNIVAAPETYDPGTLYSTWKQDHLGDWDDFMDFMTTPTGERDEFMLRAGVAVDCHDNIFRQVAG